MGLTQGLPAITIRAATHTDAETLADMAQRLALEEGRESRATAGSIMQDLLGESTFAHVFLAEIGGEAAGFIWCYPGYDLESASTGCHLGDVFVQPAFRSRGVGAALMAHLARHVQSQGGQWLSWTVLRSNHAAQGFYARMSAVQADVSFLSLGPNGLHKLGTR